MIPLMSQWIHITKDLNSGLSNHDRFERLLSIIRQYLKCDASALLLYRDQQFIPLAINGLAQEVLGRRFELSAHPRLETIARAGDVVRFPADSTLADPFDGLIPNHSDDLDVHSCIGLPLLIDDQLIGAITVDAFEPDKFNHLSNTDLRFISALATSGLHTALLLEQLDNQENVKLKPLTKNHTSKQEMIGRSSSMQSLQDQIDAVANSDLSVLVLGETGVGKELVANAIHNRSLRANEQLVYLNCAALPESVAESELFGHIKGAFTGAISNRKGKFEQADGGTLFLDEVGELSLSLQAKLLRVLQFGDIQRVGSDNHITVNTRIVAATNRSMEEEVKAGRFRADLYHRLSVFPIFVPPLRNREDDAILLAGFFVERIRDKIGIKSIRLDEQLIQKIKEYSWPGNVRELEHLISRAAVLARASTNSADLILSSEHFMLPKEEGSTQSDAHINRVEIAVNIKNESNEIINLKEATNQFQKKLIEKTYKKNNRNWSATARELNVDVGNLHRLAKRLALK